MVNEIRRREGFKPHILKRNQEHYLPRYIFVVDTEAYQENKKEYHLQKLRLGWIVYKDLRYEKEDWYMFRTREEFYKFIEKHLRKGKKYYVFAHNFDYDAQILNLLNISKYMNVEITHFVIDSRNFILEAKYKKPEWDEKHKATLVFISTTNFFKASLDELGKMFNMPKMEIDIFNAPDEELAKYCKQDVKILLTLIEYYINFIRYHNLGHFRYTIASQSFTTFRHRFMNTKIYIHNNPEALELELKSYKGGRSEAFYIGDLSKFGKIYKLDINSMYPYVMREQRYPKKLVGVIKDVSVSRLKELMKHYLVIAEMDIEVKEPVVGVKKERLIFPVGKIHDVFTSPEIELIMKYGKIHKVYKVALYQGSYLFREYIDYFYKLRLKYKKEGNKIMSYFVKIFMNSLYGKFGQKTENLELVGEAPDEDNRIERIYDGDIGKWRYCVYFNKKLYEKKGYILSDDSFPAIASFVTAYARCYLTKLIYVAGRRNVFYCDTDSLFVSEEGYNRLKEYIDDKELGKLKVEDVAQKVIIHNVKDYEFEDEVKLKGIKKDAVKVENNTFIQKQFVRIRGNLTKYREDGVIIQEITKKLNRKYAKGQVRLDGWVEPFKFETYDQYESGITNYDDYIQKVTEEYERAKETAFTEYINSDLFDKEAFWDNNLTEHENLINLKRIFRDYMDESI